MAEEKRKGLGRGLAALLGEDSEIPPAAPPARGIRTLPIEHLRPGRFQPRRRMDEAPIQELAKSIAARGILQPILARKAPADFIIYFTYLYNSCFSGRMFHDIIY